MRSLPFLLHHISSAISGGIHTVLPNSIPASICSIRDEKASFFSKTVFGVLGFPFLSAFFLFPFSIFGFLLLKIYITRSMMCVFERERGKKGEGGWKSVRGSELVPTVACRYRQMQASFVYRSRSSTDSTRLEHLAVAAKGYAMRESEERIRNSRTWGLCACVRVRCLP